MKKVNRIRFNSLTASTNSESRGTTTKVKKRSRSCPHLPKIESLDGESDETDPLSRSVSATFKSVESPMEESTDNGFKILNVATKQKLTRLRAVTDEEEKEFSVDSASHVTTTVTTTITSQVKTNVNAIATSSHSANAMHSERNRSINNEYEDMISLFKVPTVDSFCLKCKQDLAVSSSKGNISISNVFCAVLILAFSRFK